MKREHIASISGFYAQRLLPGALGIGMLPWLYETAGAFAYQRYSMAVLLIGTVAMLFGTWLTQSALRNLNRSGYDRWTLLLLLRMLALSAAVAGLIGVLLLRLAPPSLQSESVWMFCAIVLLTIQSVLLPLIQAMNKHMSCLLSELVRTLGPVAIIGLAGQRYPHISAIVELSMVVGIGISLLVMMPALYEVMKSSLLNTVSAPLHNSLAMLRYGAPLSVYNGLSMWLQYATRSALAAYASATTAGGSLVMAADLSQKVVSSICAPLMASQMPAMVVAFNEGNIAQVDSKIRLLQMLFLTGSAVLIIGVASAYLSGIWIFEIYQVAICACITIIGNTLIYLAACAQKTLELQGATVRIASGMVSAAVVSSACIHFLPPSVQTAYPGVSLLAGAAVLYLMITFFLRRSL